MRHVSLFRCVCLSSPSKDSQPTPHGHGQPPPTQCHHPQLTTESINPNPPKRDFTRERRRTHSLNTQHNPQPQSTAQPTIIHYNQPPNQSTHTHNPKPSNQPKPTNQLSTHKSIHTMEST